MKEIVVNHQVMLRLKAYLSPKPAIIRRLKVAVMTFSQNDHQVISYTKELGYEVTVNPIPSKDQRKGMGSNPGPSGLDGGEFPRVKSGKKHGKGKISARNTPQPSSSVARRCTICNKRCAHWYHPDVTQDWDKTFLTTQNGKRYKELVYFGWINSRKKLSQDKEKIIDNEVRQPHQLHTRYYNLIIHFSSSKCTKSTLSRCTFEQS